MKVYFVGSGPGDPELLTLRAKRLLESADVVVYAGSLTNPAILEFAKGAELYDSSGMTLEEIVEIMERAVRQGRRVVRLHSGDPSIYGAAGEQIQELKKRGIECELVPGVSSFLAAAARLGVEYTVPGVSQTVILTRIAGRTPVPEKERLEELAKHRASMVIFLSASHIEEVVKQLLRSYPPATPAAVVYRASWEDEMVIRSCLGEIAPLVERAGIRRSALILVGDFLEKQGERSRLYNKEFTHGFRRRKK
ncbi:precorrin-4 C(11)-methyltransferase [Candidatus Pyrohabitans sp.]